jgi:hypothetical protein
MRDVARPIRQEECWKGIADFELSSSNMSVTSGFVHDFALTEIILTDIMLKSNVSKRNGNFIPNYTRIHCFTKTISVSR